ncbi:hypothetical protein ANN_27192 [Periplaneta americana]|uniref:Reverse transcriptase n=1 Tax=Periplaneta americana TaxID=6978 RepID=A0ABQ8RXH2_PERAM|nr:hypothetical protein ANN_27192 [Periplaneta americana]
MSPESSTKSYPAFAHIGLRENPRQNLNQQFLAYLNRSGIIGIERLDHFLYRLEVILASRLDLPPPPLPPPPHHAPTMTTIITTTITPVPAQYLKKMEMVHTYELMASRLAAKPGGPGSIPGQVRSVPGRSFNTTCCCHPDCNKTETLGHVLGFCRNMELLHNNRHHKARTGIADVLKSRGLEVYEEIHCVSSLDSNRRADIVAIHRTQSKGLVLDPTIRFERDALQAQHVDEEKKSIYESCIPYLSEKYNIPTIAVSE